MELKVEYEDKVISFNVIRRKRKTTCIRIDASGIITIIAPSKASEEYILDLVKSKVNWIIRKQDELKNIRNKKVNREIVQGGSFMYLGEEYPIHIILKDKLKKINVQLIDDVTSSCKVNKLLQKELDNNGLNGRGFIVYTNTLEAEEIKLALEKWYRERTLQLVKNKINLYQIHFKDKVTEIKVKEQKRRWASCTGKNAILFNWRCSMAREDVLDYIVIHEMCHIDHKNHSKDFWNRVESIMPDYKEKHNWLKINGINMTLENL